MPSIFSNSTSQAQRQSEHAPTLPPSNVTSPSTSSLVYLHTDVGFSNLPNWILQNTRNQGTNLNLLVIGAPGKGKSTLLNMLFDAQVLAPTRQRHPAKELGEKAIEFVEYENVVTEAGVQVQVNIVEVIGFGELGQSKE